MSLLPGRYYIVAIPPGPFMTDPEFLESVVKDATAIAIGEDEQRTVDLRLSAPADR
jgi:hypothetical protein